MSMVSFLEDPERLMLDNTERLMLCIVILGNVSVDSVVAEEIGDVPAACSLLLEVLQQNQATNSTITTCVCMTLANLSKHAKVAQSLWLNGLAPILLHIMDAKSSQNVVVNAVFLMMGNLAAVSNASRQQIQQSSLCEVICSLLKTFIPLDAPSVVENGCVVIANMSVDAETRVKLSDWGVT